MDACRTPPRLGHLAKRRLAKELSDARTPLKKARTKSQSDLQVDSAECSSPKRLPSTAAIEAPAMSEAKAADAEGLLLPMLPQQRVGAQELLGAVEDDAENPKTPPNSIRRGPPKTPGAPKRRRLRRRLTMFTSSEEGDTEKVADLAEFPSAGAAVAIGISEET